MSDKPKITTVRLPDLDEVAEPTRNPPDPSQHHAPPDWRERAERRLPARLTLAAAVTWLCMRDEELTAEYANLNDRRLDIMLARRRHNPDPIYFALTVDAYEALRLSCEAGAVVASGLPGNVDGPDGSDRMFITALNWSDLEFRVNRYVFASPPQGLKGVCFHDIRCERGSVLKAWPPSKPIVAAQQTQSCAAVEQHCRKHLAEVMRASPGASRSKASMKLQFPEISKRAFDRAWSAAAREAEAPAWIAPGRKRKSPHP